MAAPRRRPLSVPDETERVSCRIREDAPTPLSVTFVEQRPAAIEDVLLGSVQVLDRQVKMELLGMSGVGPPRRPIVFRALEGQDEPTVGVERCPALAERPPWIRPVHHAAEKRLVEPGQLTDISTVQHHTLQLGNHERQRLTTADQDPQLERRQVFSGA